MPQLSKGTYVYNNDIDMATISTKQGDLSSIVYYKASVRSLKKVNLINNKKDFLSILFTRRKDCFKRKLLCLHNSEIIIVIILVIVCVHFFHVLEP